MHFQAGWRMFFVIIVNVHLHGYAMCFDRRMASNRLEPSEVVSQPCSWNWHPYTDGLKHRMPGHFRKTLDHRTPATSRVCGQMSHWLRSPPVACLSFSQSNVGSWFIIPLINRNQKRFKWESIIRVKKKYIWKGIKRNLIDQIKGNLNNVLACLFLRDILKKAMSLNAFRQVIW